MNSVLIAVAVMLILALCRVHVVLSLFIGALVGGLLGGLGFDGTLVAFQEGLPGGARIALSYALLGAFAMAARSSDPVSEAIPQIALDEGHGANAVNVLTFSRFKHWDPEMGGGAGMQYPTQRTFNLGLQVTFK